MNTWSTSSVRGSPGGSSSPSRSFCASSMMPIVRSVPAMLKRPLANSMSADARLQHVGGDLLALLDDERARLGDGRAAGHDRLGTARAAAGDEPVAVALHQADLVEGHAELGRQHLREGGPVALPVVQRAGDDGDRAVGLEMDAAHFVAGRRGHFEVAADAAPAQLAVLLRSPCGGP